MFVVLLLLVGVDFVLIFSRNSISIRISFNIRNTIRLVITVEILLLLVLVLIVGAIHISIYGKSMLVLVFIVGVTFVLLILVL